MSHVISAPVTAPKFDFDMGHIFNSNANYAMPSKGATRFNVWTPSGCTTYERTDETNNMGGSTQKHYVYKNSEGKELYASSWFSFYIPYKNGDDEYLYLSYGLDRGNYASDFQYNKEQYYIKFDDQGRIVFMDRATKMPVLWFDWESPSPWGF